MASEDFQWHHWSRGVGDVSGVYALIKNPPVIPGRSRILYIGSSTVLNSRHRLRVDDASEKIDHHLLWYIADAAPDDFGEVNVALPALGIPKGESAATHLEGTACVHYQLTPGNDIEYEWNGKRSKPKCSMIEELLLIRHFFEYGCYPPFNAKNPSIRSITDWWNENWWQKYWTDYQVEHRWNGLLER